MENHLASTSSIFHKQMTLPKKFKPFFGLKKSASATKGAKILKIAQAPFLRWYMTKVIQLILKKKHVFQLALPSIFRVSCFATTQGSKNVEDSNVKSEIAFQSPNYSDHLSWSWKYFVNMVVSLHMIVLHPKKGRVQREIHLLTIDVQGTC